MAPVDGATYVIRVELNDHVTQAALKKIVDMIKNKAPWMKIIAAKSSGRRVYIVYRHSGPSPFQIGTVLASILPEIFGAAGFVMVAAVMYMAIKALPTWAIVLGIIGIILIAFAMASGVVHIEAPKIEYKGEIKKRFGGA